MNFNMQLCQLGIFVYWLLSSRTRMHVNQVGINYSRNSKDKTEAKMLMEAFCPWHQLKKNPLPNKLKPRQVTNATNVQTAKQKSFKVMSSYTRGSNKSHPFAVPFVDPMLSTQIQPFWNAFHHLIHPRTFGLTKDKISLLPNLLN